MSIKKVPIRAEIMVGKIVVVTPYVLSFSVNKNRNSKSTFQASLKIPGYDLTNIQDNTITIRAGEKDKLQLIFTGYVLNSTPSPCWDDPTYIILNISGSDILHRLENERYTRRQITANNKWAVITGVQRVAPKSGHFRLVNYDVLIPTDGDIATQDQTRDKQLHTTDLSKYGMTVQKGDPRTINIQITPEGTEQ